jgi:hypothetical protein
MSLSWACGPPTGMKAHPKVLLIPNGLPRDFRRSEIPCMPFILNPLHNSKVPQRINMACERLNSPMLPKIAAKTYNMSAHVCLVGESAYERNSSAPRRPGRFSGR